MWWAASRRAAKGSGPARYRSAAGPETMRAGETRPTAVRLPARPEAEKAICCFGHARKHARVCAWRRLSVPFAAGSSVGPFAGYHAGPSEPSGACRRAFRTQRPGCGSRPCARNPGESMSRPVSRGRSRHPGELQGVPGSGAGQEGTSPPPGSGRRGLPSGLPGPGRFASPSPSGKPGTTDFLPPGGSSPESPISHRGAPEPRSPV